MSGAAGLASDMARMRFMGDQRGRAQIDDMVQKTRIKALAEKVMALPEKTPDNIMALARQYNATPEEGKQVLDMLKGFIDYKDTLDQSARRGVLEGRQDTQWEQGQQDRTQMLADQATQRKAAAEDRSRLVNVIRPREDTTYQQSQDDRTYALGRRDEIATLERDKALADIGLKNAQAGYYKDGRRSGRSAAAGTKLTPEQTLQSKFMMKKYETLQAQREAAEMYGDTEKVAEIDEKIEQLEADYQALSGGGGGGDRGSGAGGKGVSTGTYSWENVNAKDKENLLSNWGLIGQQLYNLPKTQAPGTQTQAPPPPSNPAPGNGTTAPTQSGNAITDALTPRGFFDAQDRKKELQIINNVAEKLGVAPANWKAAGEILYKTGNKAFDTWAEAVKAIYNIPSFLFNAQKETWKKAGITK